MGARRRQYAVVLAMVLLGAGSLVISTPASADATYGETVGRTVRTWTDPATAGGAAGPPIKAYDTVQVACKLRGFRVADGNDWWYRIASSPWNYALYASADAFYNNVATSGRLAGNPSFDPAVPDCPGTDGVEETAAEVAATWTDPASARGTAGRQVDPGQTVTIACKRPGFRVADGNEWWYRIASAPWNGDFYVTADAFYNNGSTSGPLVGAPWWDPAVPDCAGSSGGSAAGPVVRLAKGPAAPTGYRYGISLTGFAANSAVSLTCYDSASPEGFSSMILTTDGSGSAATQRFCYSGDGPDHWVVANGRVESNHLGWRTSSVGGSGGATPGRSVTINGIDVGIAQDRRRAWGPCTVQPFDGGPLGQLVVSYTGGPHLVRGAMLAAWTSQGGAPGYGCPTGDEHSYADGTRQTFAGGSLYRSDTTAVRPVTWGDFTDIHWAGYAAQGSLVASVRAVWTQPTITCDASATERSEAVFWAGIDGFTSADGLIQAGSGGSCAPGSATATNFLWFETDPRAPMTRFATVSPGDLIEVKVDYLRADQRYSMSVSVNGAVTKAVSGTLAEKAHSGECVAEATVGPTGVVHLAQFTPVTFSTCTVSTATHSRPVPIASGVLPSEVRATRITMAKAPGALKTATSLPAADGSWAVTWLRP